MPAKVSELKLFVIASHLKSSRGATGDSDRTNAQKRELVAAAVAEQVVKLRQDNFLLILEMRLISCCELYTFDKNLQ